MIIYDSKIARLLQGRLNPYDYVTLPIVTLIALPYGEIGIWEEMEMRIHRRRMLPCVTAAVPASGLASVLGICPPATVRLLPPSFTGLNAWLSAIQRLTTRQKKRARK